MVRQLLPILFFVGFALRAQSLDGVIDVHVHCGPDVVPRSIDALDVAALAAKRGLRGVVLKNHYEPTASLAYFARKMNPGLQTFGGIDLNRAVGGVNPAAVERMTRVEGGRGIVVWMPTFDAENEVRRSGVTRPFVSVAKNGRLLPEVIEVLDLIAKNKLVLATGHSSPAEVQLLIEEARRRGIDRIIVTHPMILPVEMNTDQMKKAAASGAYLEFVYSALLGPTATLTIGDYARAIRAVGIERSILSSDLGQAGNSLPPDGLEAFFAALRKEGFTVAEIERMAKANPAHLLGLQ